MVQRPTDTSALQLSCPPDAVTRTVPLGVMPEVTVWKTTSTPCPGWDGSGESETICVLVSVALTRITPVVTEASWDAANSIR